MRAPSGNSEPELSRFVARRFSSAAKRCDGDGYGLFTQLLP
jgi:hypothetical protein